MNPILGVVLCGGRSSRMGSDKGLLYNNNSRWAIRQGAILEALKLPVVLSINGSQENTYKTQTGSYQIIGDKIENVQGPLEGILSVHKHFPDHDLLVIACDMQRLSTAPLQWLLDNFSGHSSVAYNNEGAVEPLCAIYKAADLNFVHQKAKAGTLQSFSLYKTLQSIKATYINIPSQWQSCFANFNSPQDLLSL